MSIDPKDAQEQMALFRAMIVGRLSARHLLRGELKQELEQLIQEKYQPPNTVRSRTFGFSTLERWHYALSKHGLEGVKPKPRSDRGYAQNLTEAERQLLLDIAEQQPEVSIPVLLREVIATGRLRAHVASEATIRRLFDAFGLNRQKRRALLGKIGRRRWQKAHPHQLWHADVCHGPKLEGDTRKIPLRVHGIMDDASRYVVGLRALSTEREIDMLLLLADALRRYPAPRMLYVDNGATYSGKGLEVVCGRLDIRLVHARPYDPQARGKMERFWRTLRAGCLDFVGSCRSLHDVQVRLIAFLERHYHCAAHGGLRGGAAPREVFRAAPAPQPLLSEDTLEAAFTVRGNRTVSRDGVISVGGVLWEVEASFLANRKVTIARSLLSKKRPPWIEADDTTYSVRPLDPVANGKCTRHPKRPKLIDAIPFDPATALLHELTGQNPADKENTR